LESWLDCGPLPCENLYALGWSVIEVKLSGRERGRQGVAEARLLRKICRNGHKTSFFEVMSELQKDLEDISAGIGIF
jgi:hypothetical protein